MLKAAYLYVTLKLCFFINSVFRKLKYTVMLLTSLNHKENAFLKSQLFDLAMIDRNFQHLIIEHLYCQYVISKIAWI